MGNGWHSWTRTTSGYPGNWSFRWRWRTRRKSAWFTDAPCASIPAADNGITMSSTNSDLQDDIWLPRKLELQMALANSPQVGLVYGRTLCFYPSGRQRDYDEFHEFSWLPEGDIFAQLLGRGCFIAMSS